MCSASRVIVIVSLGLKSSAGGNERPVAARVVDARVHAAVERIDPRAPESPRIARVDVPPDRAVLIPNSVRRDVGVRRRTFHRQIDDAAGAVKP